MQAASDAAIWDHAIAHSAVVVTKDKDFVRRKVLSREGPAIWIRTPTNTRRRDLLAWFGTVLPHVVSALERGETSIEVV